ncbi:UBX [Macleaya cordata]|uniref:UBX n=1 Tax=Macleaya cordata TaxID=56857 RepID=A0A200RBC8_MACCD|nr:UBX [Macleaya cordata]
MEKEGENANKHLVETFCEITSSSKEEALFFLESHNWNLDSAVSTFLEDTTTTPNYNDLTNPNYQSDSPSSSPPPSLPPSIPPPTFQSSVQMASRPDKKPSKPSGRRTGGIRTLSDLNRPSGPDSDSDSDEPQEYYTGGEKSGMLVQDPTRGGNDVDSIFNQARQLGAVEGSTDHHRPSASSRSFTGTGRLLSGETVAASNNPPQEPEAVTHNIVFWNDGFTVNDGPLRRLDDPENAAFLESIRKSECPKELEPADRKSSVHVNLIRREGNRPEPEKQHIPFQGVGRTLGTNSSSTAAPEPTVAATTLNTAPTPSMGLVVDDTLPSTSIQLRLADGTRMIARFNYHHTISDIRAFIDASRPGGARNYQLQTVGFPPKQLTDVKQTIEEAGLANSVLIQKP